MSKFDNKVRRNINKMLEFLKSLPSPFLKRLFKYSLICFYCNEVTKTRVIVINKTLPLIRFVVT